jgi:hypothetical protein
MHKGSLARPAARGLLLAVLAPIGMPVAAQDGADSFCN